MVENAPVVLTPLQLSLLRVLADARMGEWLYTREVGDSVPISLIVELWCKGRGITTLEEDHYGTGEERIRELFIANRCGQALGKMAKIGYVIRERVIPFVTVKDRPSYPGESSRWKLGPLSDLLKEQGILS